MTSEVAFDPDVFHGELTANRAQVFVRLPRIAGLEDCTLHGFVHGPRCEYAHTLPAKYPLNDLGAGPTLLARATVTDPCFWTSDLPQIYDVQLELRRGSETLAREQRMIGLRGIGARATGLVREGKTWTPRGVAVELMEQNAQHLHDELLVGICSSPPLDLLVEASRRGAYLAAKISAANQDVESTLRALARWPAVMMAIIRDGEHLDRSTEQAAPNLLLVQAIQASKLNTIQPAPWAAAVVVELDAEQPVVPQIVRLAAKLPVLVQRSPLAEVSVATDARMECDRLQRDLAPLDQFAGYLIG